MEEGDKQAFEVLTDNEITFRITFKNPSFFFCTFDKHPDLSNWESNPGPNMLLGDSATQ